MNLLQLTEASLTEYKGWKGRNGSYGGKIISVIIEVPEFKPDGRHDKRYPDIYDIRVTLGKIPKVTAEREAGLALTMNTHNRSVEFRKFWNKPGKQDQLIAFAKNIMPQIIAAGDSGWTKNYSFKSTLPSTEDIIRGLLTAYKKHGHEDVTMYLNGAKRLGYKIPDNVLTGLNKSLDIEKHLAKKNKLHQAVERAKMDLDSAHEKHQAALAALKAHTGEE